MVSVTAVFGLGVFSVMVFAIAGVLRQLGAGDAAKGLLALTALVFVGVLAATYVPALISGL